MMTPVLYVIVAGITFHSLPTGFEFEILQLKIFIEYFDRYLFTYCREILELFQTHIF